MNFLTSLRRETQIVLDEAGEWVEAEADLHCRKLLRRESQIV
jgi:hypothetical protein